MSSVEEQPLLAKEPTSGQDDAAAAEPTRSATQQTGWEDPDDTVGLLDEEEEDVGETIYKPEVEAIETEDASASDPRVMMKQVALCLALVGISVYEAILKGKAVRKAKFDFTSLMVMQAVVSVFIGLVLTVKDGNLRVLFDSPKNFGMMLLKFSPPGILFAAAVYVSLITMVYLSPDVFKVLEQTRLLVMGVLGYFLLRKRLSTASWVALTGITLTCLAYGRIKTAEATHDAFTKAIQSNLVRSQNVVQYFAIDSSATGATPETGTDRSLQADNDLAKSEAEKLTEALKQLATGTLSLNESKNPMLGFLLTAIFVLISCFASVYCEVVLKKDKHLPFYIQKIFLEIPGGFFSVFCTLVLRPILMNNGIAEKKLSFSWVDQGMFFGWDNALVPVLFIFVIAKSWLSGIICKQLSAISKQLCSIVAVVILYFMILMHDCKDLPGVDPDAFMCPSGINKAVFNIIIVDLAVLCTVVSYTTALRDKKRKQMFKGQASTAEAALREIQGK